MGKASRSGGRSEKSCGSRKGVRKDDGQRVAVRSGTCTTREKRIKKGDLLFKRYQIHLKCGPKERRWEHSLVKQGVIKFI